MVRSADCRIRKRSFTKQLELKLVISNALNSCPDILELMKYELNTGRGHLLNRQTGAVDHLIFKLILKRVEAMSGRVNKHGCFIGEGQAFPAVHF